MMQARRLIEEAIGQVFAGPGGHQRHHVRCGVFDLSLGFASSDLAEAFMPAFIRAGQGTPDLEIVFASGLEIDLGGVVPHPADQFRVIADDAFYAVWMPGPQPVLFALDRPAGRAIVWLSTGEAPAWVRSRPALSLIHAMSVTTSWTALHGGAVGYRGRFIMLAGRGRSGKTTAALSCAAAGWDYAGDDYILVDVSGGAVLPLFASARLRSDLGDAFKPWVEHYSWISTADGETRHELSLSQALAQRIRGGQLAAIFLPRRRGARFPEFEPARRSDAFNALLAATTIELPGWSRVTAEKIATVVELAPTFFVDTGTDPQTIPDAFAAKLEEIERGHDGLN